MKKPREHLRDFMPPLLKYCAYRDRSEAEVLRKMRALEVPADFYEPLLEWLRSTKALNEKRFTESYVNGKFHLKKWGKQKIVQHLRQQGSQPQQIQESIDKIDTREYEATLRALIQKKSASLKEEDPFKKRMKLFRFLMGKGYEAELIRRMLDGPVEPEE